MRIACVGGGPGGVFFASLAKQLSRDLEVVVFERNRPDDTFGFGVVFSDATLAQLGEDDPVLRDRLSDRGEYWEYIEVRLKGKTDRCGGNGMAAISRKELLRLLYERADEVGVDLRFNESIASTEELGDFDLVVASDGSNSMIRSQMSSVFKPSIQTAAAKFIWFGTTYRFDGLTFLFKDSPYGVFAVHGYPINDSIGTFIVETDEETWMKAKMDAFDLSQPPGTSDEYSKDFLQSLFADQIDGHELLVNNSRWGNFKTVRNDSWHCGKYVLLGDSAHTAHFSVGSGTKMAMEDASVLAKTITQFEDDIDEALQTYEQLRRPSVEKIQGSAGPSLSWWEHFGRYYKALEPEQFAFHFLTRSITGQRLSKRDNEFVDRIRIWWKASYGAEPVSSPLDLNGVSTAGRVIEVTDGNGDLSAKFVNGDISSSLKLWNQIPDSHDQPWGALIDMGSFGGAQEQLGKIAALCPSIIAVRGGTYFQRVRLAEEGRIAYKIPTMVVEESFDADVANTLILSGRVDLVGVLRSG